GVGERFVDRFVQGAQFRDQANQMRLDEFRNAIAIIQRYPVFGIGFAQAPDIDLGAGVSSVYLALAERIGLVGLLGFLAIVAAFFVGSWRTLRSLFSAQNVAAGGQLVALQAGITAALAVGLLDHYFFNIEFSHMVALFWGVIGLAVTLEAIENREPSEF
ncbi:MAG TPA: polymerase, partial [Roseiflexaceae bacterium]|nr:polymerase [Roseiflexaceae bacterium]